MTQERPKATPPEMLTFESDLWREFIWQRCGLHFSESRLRFLRQSLWERMQHHRMRSYQEYYHYVAFNPGGAAEWQTLLELLLNNETGFFRHLPSFEAMRHHVLPTLMRDKHQQGMPAITMWSAGCSLGQEAYSLAMAFLDLVDPPPFAPAHISPVRLPQADWQVRVTGSDISQRALTKARGGQYKTYETRYLPDHYRQHYFTMSGSGHSLVYQVVPRVRALVAFRQMNLMEPETYPTLSPLALSGVDVIFCQNVLIYFRHEDRLKIVQRLCERLSLGGYLFLGPAEVVGLKLPGIEPVRLADVLIYQRAR